MLRTMKRLIALSLGMALPVEAHLFFLVCDDMTMSNVKRECHKMKRQKLPDTLDVSTPMLISSVIASFDRHDGLSDCDC